jgi:hypothetical protein
MRQAVYSTANLVLTHPDRIAALGAVMTFWRTRT